MTAKNVFGTHFAYSGKTYSYGHYFLDTTRYTHRGAIIILPTSIITIVVIYRVLAITVYYLLKINKI